MAKPGYDFQAPWVLQCFRGAFNQFPWACRWRLLHAMAFRIEWVSYVNFDLRSMKLTNSILDFCLHAWQRNKQWYDSRRHPALCQVRRNLHEGLMRSPQVHATHSASCCSQGAFIAHKICPMIWLINTPAPWSDWRYLKGGKQKSLSSW